MIKTESLKNVSRFLDESFGEEEDFKFLILSDCVLCDGRTLVGFTEDRDWENSVWGDFHFKQ